MSRFWNDESPLLVLTSDTGGEYAQILWSLWNGYGIGTEWAWNGHPEQSELEILRSLVWSGGVWNGI